MALPTPTDLAQQAKCLSAELPPSLQVPVLIAIFAQIAGMSLDAQMLVRQATCLSCVPPSLQMPVLISIAQQILAGQSTAGSACLLAGAGAPVAAPPCTVAIYFDTTNANFGMYVWVQTLATWTELIAPGP